MESTTNKTNLHPKFQDLVPLYDLKTQSDQMIAGKSFICEFTHVDISIYQNVYEPSEDTYLLIDALHFDIHYACKQLGQVKRVLEVG